MLIRRFVIVHLNDNFTEDLKERMALVRRAKTHHI